MLPTAFIYHPDCELHDTGPAHPERPERISAVKKQAQSMTPPERLLWLRPEPAEIGWIELAHDLAYISFVEEFCRSGQTIIDGGDTHVLKRSFEAALLAAGGAMAGVDAVMQDKARNAFSCCRPPGHHARPNEAMGFCLFNNAAIAARYAQKQYSLERILIIDWDVHHGNGTQEIFYDDPSVFYFSLHQHPFYPGSGGANETGAGAGKGFTLNAPMPFGAGGEEYHRAFSESLWPAAKKFHPDLILISAGFDAHRDDPLGGLNLIAEDFAGLTRETMRMAGEFCGGKLVSILEGGYDLPALAESARAHLEALSD